MARLCLKAARPVRRDLLEAMDMVEAGLTTGAVCVYPNRVKECVQLLKKYGFLDPTDNMSLNQSRYKAENVPVAAVATGFPSGQYSLDTRLQEIRMAVEAGAREIDIVINRQLALEHKWQELYE